jgi:hypothetical protein
MKIVKYIFFVNNESSNVLIEAKSIKTERFNAGVNQRN